MKIPLVAGPRLDCEPIDLGPEPPPQHNAHVFAFLADCRARRGVTCQTIIQATARHFGLRPENITSSSRFARVVLPRQIACWIAKKLCPQKSLPEIGRRFGGRDHTTILWAVRKIDLLRPERPDVDAAIRAILADLGARL